MKDNTVYLLYNTNASDIKLQKQPVKRGSFDWEYVDKDKFTIMYNPEDVRKSTEIKIHSKTKLRGRPKSAGEVMMQPKINAEGILIKRSISLSNFEDCFLNRRIPLIKPLISERQILKLQLLQEQCRKKRTGSEPDKPSLQNLDVEDKDLRKYKGLALYPESEGEKSKDKARDEISPLLSTKVTSKEDEKKPGDKKHKESEEEKKPKTPASGKSRHETKKTFKKDLSFEKSKIGIEKGKKNEKQGTSKKESIGTIKNEKQEATDKEKTKSEKSPKGEQISGKSKTKTLSESELKTSKSDSKTKPSKSKEKNKSEEKISGEDMKHEDSDKGGSKGSNKKTSKQKLKSELSEKDGISKGASEHSKDRTSQGKKSDKSNKSESGKSRKMSDSSRKRKEKDKGVEDQDMKNKLGKMKTQSEDSQEGKTVSGKAPKQSDKGDKKTKPGTTSEKTSGPLAKEKSLKTDAEEKPPKTSAGKSVKFPNVFQHIIHYVLSNPLFTKLGWTLAPSDRAQLQVVTFRTIPATPHTYCFRERTEDEIKYYSKTLERVGFHFRVDGTGEIFYPSGVPAATITNHSTGMRLTLYSDPKNDPLISDSFKSKVLAIFDSFGNGVVYDLQGKKLLNFNQLEGIFCSPNRQSPYKWQWCDYKILDQQRLKALLRYMAKEQKQPAPTKKSPPSNISTPKKAKPEEKKSEVDVAYEQILAELPYPVPQKTKTKSENQVWGFKPITLKINSEMALRINGQDDITVSFSSNQIFLRIDLGVKIDPDVVERIEALAPKRVSDVPCVFDGLLDPTQSLLQLTGRYKKSSSKNKLSVT